MAMALPAESPLTVMAESANPPPGVRVMTLTLLPKVGMYAVFPSGVIAIPYGLPRPVIAAPTVPPPGVIVIGVTSPSWKLPT